MMFGEAATGFVTTHMGQPHTRTSGTRHVHRTRREQGPTSFARALATSARADIWNMEPEQLARIVRAFHDWEKVNANLTTTGDSASLLDYTKSPAHSQRLN